MLALVSGGWIVHGQDPLATLPKNYRVVFENASVQVQHVIYGPHEKLPVHDHPAYPTVYIYLTDSGPVKFSHVETKAFVSTRANVTAGTFRVSPGRVEKHEVENTGDIASEFLRVELKQVPLGFQAKTFRSPKVFDRANSGVRTEFESPQFRVRRVIAVGSHATDVSGRGLLVALTPATVGSRPLRVGDVLWVDSGEDRIQSVADAADLLFVSF